MASLLRVTALCVVGTLCVSVTAARPAVVLAQCDNGSCKLPRSNSGGSHMSSQEQDSQSGGGGEMDPQQIMQMLMMMLPMLMQLGQQNQANNQGGAPTVDGAVSPGPNQNDPDAQSMLARFQATETAAAIQTGNAERREQPAATPTVAPTVLPTTSQRAYEF